MEDDHYKGYFIPKGWWLLFLKASIIADKASSIPWQ
jgi:hypothetical protein